VRTNYESLALHFLESALQLSPQDSAVLNELGVVFLRLQRLEDALHCLGQASEHIVKSNQQSAEVRVSILALYSILV
jgi:Flp pilus assembly protein TadD